MFRKLTSFIPLCIVIVVIVFLLASKVDVSSNLYIFLIVGFSAQLIDGALGMGFGMVSTATLLGFGINPTTISSSVHTAEVFSSAASGISHHRNGNINKKLFLSLLITGVIGSIVGALLLVFVSNVDNSAIKVIVAVYTMILGFRLLYLFFRRRFENRTVKNKSRVRILALVGGFLDSFGGGGWGPVVTSTLVSRGHEPKYVIGSVNAAEFFIALASSLTFFIAIGIHHWDIILALVSGGVAAAPIAAKTTNKVTSRILLLSVGILVIIWSLYTILKLVL